MGVLVEEVGKLYEGYVSGAESPLAELAIQYGDYAVWQREWLQGAVLAEQVEYWREQLARRAWGAGVADGPAATDSAELSWGHICSGDFVQPERAVEATEPARRSDVVHDVAGGLQGIAVALHGTSGDRGGNAGGEPATAGSGRA